MSPSRRVWFYSIREAYISPYFTSSSNSEPIQKNIMRKKDLWRCHGNKINAWRQTVHALSGQDVRQWTHRPKRNCITVHFQKCVYSVEGSLFREKTVVLPSVVATGHMHMGWDPLVSTVETTFRHFWRWNRAPVGPSVHMDQCARTPAQHPLVEPPRLCLSTIASPLHQHSI